MVEYIYDILMHDLKRYANIYTDVSDQFSTNAVQGLDRNKVISCNLRLANASAICSAIASSELLETESHANIKHKVFILNDF